QVRFVIGDIIQQQTDAIVNSSNFKLKFTGQVSQAIRLAAGPGVVKQCQDYIGQNQNLDVSDVFVTDGGHLQCKHIMHTSTPAYKNDGLDNYQKPLADTYLNCLNKALKKDIQSISFPILGSG
ncbi:hypothetical protein HELRODRAFT_136124, partial [Helobdella robusta]|uniref:Macro domain-containing protein n=1 Tax=Helobdella robusta TaxID=6412 RepID=T1EIC2_HELRO